MDQWTARSVLAIAAVVMLAGVFLPAQAQTTTAGEASLLSALADKTEALGKCNADLGPLQQLQASVLKGQLRAPADVVADVKAAIEKANPGKTIDVTGKIIDRPASTIPAPAAHAGRGGGSGR